MNTHRQSSNKFDRNTMATSPHAAAQTQMSFSVDPGRPPVNLRQVFNGILYLTKTGCQWRMLPKASGCWQTRVWVFQQMEPTRHRPKDPTVSLQKGATQSGSLAHRFSKQYRLTRH